VRELININTLEHMWIVNKKGVLLYSNRCWLKLNAMKNACANVNSFSLSVSIFKGEIISFSSSILKVFYLTKRKVLINL